MGDDLVIRGKRGDFNDYEKFITKFKAAKTTDDCYTPQPIYEAVVDYVFRKGNLPEDTEIVRPFRPNGDYTAERAAAERAAAMVVRLTPQELRMIDELDGKIKPFYDQTLF